MIGVPGAYLRRPLSVFSVSKGVVEFVYKVVGRGTEALSEMKAGEEINVLGPLGNGYEAGLLKNGQKPVFMAGGTGIASLNFLAARIDRAGTLLYGAKTKGEMICLEVFRKKGWDIETATEDGSAGKKGFVTELLEDHLPGLASGRNVLFACGPHAMIENAGKISKKSGFSFWASFEEKMACGTGLCQGCVTEINGEYVRVCKEGPVFKI
ncbi:MAG: hypothetical protein JW803_03420 [Endomicrobiales bacterium]|nr:hypothetical protein [Endomicrobiales bacterium]